jgi:hypothetical protein
MMIKRSSIKCSLIAALLSCAAYASEPHKPANPQDMKQETVALGDNRFIIFNGSPNADSEYGYTADLIKIENGTPHFDPLFIEEYDADNNASHLTYGVAFMCSSYRFDKATSTFTYTAVDPENKARLQLTYKLDVDIFKLQEVVSQKTASCEKEPCAPLPPTTLFKIADAKTH